MSVWIDEFEYWAMVVGGDNLDHIIVMDICRLFTFSYVALIEKKCDYKTDSYGP